MVEGMSRVWRQIALQDGRIAAWTDSAGEVHAIDPAIEFQIGDILILWSDAGFHYDRAPKAVSRLRLRWMRRGGRRGLVRV